MLQNIFANPAARTFLYRTSWKLKIIRGYHWFNFQKKFYCPKYVIAKYFYKDTLKL